MNTRFLRRLPRRGQGRLPQRLASGIAAQAHHVSVHRGDRRILAEVDVAVRYGEVLALVGPNGAGKSTLLSALAGDLAPSTGRIDIDGAPIGTWTPKELAWRRAVLPQQNGLAFPFRVHDVVLMGRAPWGEVRERDRLSVGSADGAEWDDDRIVADALRRTSCTELVERTVPSLSGGEMARVALARTIAQQAPLLLLDEPTAAMDVRHQELVLRLAVEQAARGDAVVVVLHDLDVAGAYADRIALLAHGRLRAVGAPHEVLTEQLLTHAYDHPVEVIPHPRTGVPMVLPRRD